MLGSSPFLSMSETKLFPKLGILLATSAITQKVVGLRLKTVTVWIRPMVGV